MKRLVPVVLFAFLMIIFGVAAVNVSTGHASYVATPTPIIQCPGGVCPTPTKTPTPLPTATPVFEFGVGQVFRETYGNPPGAPTRVVANLKGAQSSWYNWGAVTAFCNDHRYIPMAWGISQTLPLSDPKCNDGRPGFILNECAENHPYSGQQKCSVDQMVNAIARNKTWKGDLYCCGGEYDDWDLTQRVFTEYISRTGKLDVDGLHIHLYDTTSNGLPHMVRWNNLAWRFNMSDRIIVSEFASFHNEPDAAATLTNTVSIIRSQLNPFKMFYFALHIPSDWPLSWPEAPGQYDWHRNDLYNAEPACDTANLSQVGQVYKALGWKNPVGCGSSSWQ